ncbi:hypothetical protein [Cohnella abietis]|uniref:Uncharacterized protein n=1 Tax=Cohnella abietis TaxID=2507935 RepID=A0A3T1D7Q4_9BACL|nr:hypothetical protein [Cohnella abietis]BBI34104.1 hypothetical protein KCTCHS21_35030 [Cohnella abietis]
MIHFLTTSFSNVQYDIFNEEVDAIMRIMVGVYMKRTKIRRIFNLTAMALVVIYISGVIISLMLFYFFNLDDDFEFWFIINFLLWGGVALLITVLILMLTKITILKE